jgi:type VI secretion system protein ImpH
MEPARGQSNSDVEAGPTVPTAVPPSPVVRRMEREPWSFAFFQAVRLLQRYGADRARPGNFQRPDSEAVRFGSNASLAFPPAEIQSSERTKSGQPLLRTNFLGLIGATGVLPTQYTAMIIERLLAEDASFRDFIDIFQHRLLSLFYRAWEKYAFVVPYERGDADSITPRLFDLIGFGTAGLHNRQEAPDEALIAYAGLLGQFPRSASALEQILSDYFEVPVEVQTFAGTWRRLDPSSWSRLGDGNTRNEQLGAGTVLGDEVWDEQSLVRIRLGPLSLARYQQFLPAAGGRAIRELNALKRFFCGEEVDVEVQLVLDRNEAPRLGLGTGGVEPKLGWISWMFTGPLDRDPDETIVPLWEG